MKILRIVYDWPPPWLGLAPHPYEITVSQAKQGNKIDVFCGRWPKAGPIECPEGVTVHPVIRELIPSTIFFTSSILLFFKYILWRQNNKADVIHSHGHFAVWIYLYRNLLKKYFPWAEELKTPLVVHFHNTAKGRWESFDEKSKAIKPESQYMAWPMAVYSDKQAVKAAAACIFVSEETKNEAVKFYNADPKRCFVVETGVNTDMFVTAGNEEKEKSRHDLDLDLYDKVILNLGVISERKNVHLIVEALAFLPPHYKLILAGTGDASYAEKMNEVIKSKKLEDRIIKTGYVPYPQVPIAYQISDVFVLPSDWEGLPKAVMEALSCGIPCLVSGFKVSDDIKGLFYLENKDPKYIAEQISKIVENHAEVDTNVVRRHYSWDKRVIEIEKIYEFAKQNYI
jgi:glycosyltransferase involved in cell wall biosynthesis